MHFNEARAEFREPQLQHLRGLPLSVVMVNDGNSHVRRAARQHQAELFWCKAHTVDGGCVQVLGDLVSLEQNGKTKGTTGASG